MTLLVKFMYENREALTVDTVISYFGATWSMCVLSRSSPVVATVYQLGGCPEDLYGTPGCTVFT